MRPYKKREVFVFQVSKHLRKTDQIRKAYHALSRTFNNNNSETLEGKNMDMLHIGIANKQDVFGEKLIESN